jgi:RNA polymerase sigma-70 factor (ECF subfamily)
MPRAQAPAGLERVIRRAQDGDLDAFETLYRRYAARVLRSVRFIVRDLDLAEDVTQQTFTRLLDSGVARFRRLPDATFDAWLLQVAQNLARDALRAERRRRTSAYPLEEPAAEDAIDHQTIAVLLEAIAQLPALQRRIVVLHHLQGWSLEEIATDFGRTKQSVHSLHFRARRHLVRDLGEAGVRPRVLAAAA